MNQQNMRAKCLRIYTNIATGAAVGSHVTSLCITNPSKYQVLNMHWVRSSNTNTHQNGNKKPLKINTKNILHQEKNFQNHLLLLFNHILPFKCGKHHTIRHPHH